MANRIERLRVWVNRPVGHKLNSLGVHLSRLGHSILSFVLTPVCPFFVENTHGRRVFYERQAPNTILFTKTDSLDFFVNSSDKEIGKNTYCNKRPYDADKLTESLRLIEKIRGTENQRIELLIDVGANIGTIGLTAVAANLVDRCLAFEPGPTNFKLLEMNIKHNDLSGLVDAHNLALSEGGNLELEFELDDSNFGDHRVRISDVPGLYGESSRQVIKVATAKLDDFMNQISPLKSILWMDVQGFEGHVLAGATEVLSAGIPIVTEFWPYGLERSNCVDKFFDALADGNYKHFAVLDGTGLYRSFNREELTGLASELGWQGKFTDILVC
jgi:FkbM family methyltransferase